MDIKCINCNLWCSCKNTAMLIARIVLAVILISNGLEKIMNPESVTALFTGFFGNSGVAILYIVALAETLSGLMLFAGIYVTYASLIVIFISIVSGIMKIIGIIPGDWNSAFQSEFTLVALAFMIASYGAGKWVMLHDSKNCGCGCDNKKENCSNGTCNNSWCNTCNK